MKLRKLLALALTGALSLSLLAGCQNNTPTGGSSTPADQSQPQTGAQVPEGALVIKEQGMFSSGGTVTEPVAGDYDATTNWLDTARPGNTAHVGHANVLYQIPQNETGLPMVFLHGYGQSRMGWMTTPDGREGWDTMFLRGGHSVFLVDQPGRGEAGAATEMTMDGMLDAWGSDSKEYKPGDQAWYTHFRIGRVAPDRYEGSQFPEGDEAQNQFFRQMTPNTTSFDQAASAAAMGEVMADVKEMTGQKSIFVTHSQGGAVGWDVPVENIAAIVAIEPGGTPQPGSEQYQRLLAANIPIVVYFGDYIDNGPEDIQSTSFWGMVRDGALAFAEQYNADGGSATVVDLPKEGITGNSHFMFQELNNDVIASHVEAWIQANVNPDSSSGTVSNPTPTGGEGGKTLVAYYSASGNTQAVAQTIADVTGGDLFEIVPAEEYTSADLNWTDNNSRVSKEHDDPSLRNVALTADTVDNWEDYDTVFIGYPIWWGIAAWPTDTFVKANDFTGKTVIPFCTSSSSGLGDSGTLLAELAGTGSWLEGQRFRSSVSEADVTEWVNGLGL
ncbi:flavodoxin [Oscillospiraceae bacterium 44-5]